MITYSPDFFISFLSRSSRHTLAFRSHTALVLIHHRDHRSKILYA